MSCKMCPDKKKGIKCIVLAVFIILSAVLLIFYLKDQKEKKTKIKTITYKDNYEDFLFMEKGTVNENNMAIVTSKNTTTDFRMNKTIPGEWVCLIDAEYQIDTENNLMLNIKKADYNFCDLMTGELIKTIDAKRISEETAPDQIVARPSGGQIFRDENGEPWMHFALLEKNSPEKWGDFYINIETEEARMKSCETKTAVVVAKSTEDTEETKEEKADIFFDDIIGLLEANGFNSYYLPNSSFIQEGLYVSQTHKGQCYIETLAKYLPENNEALYKEFPGLKDYEGSEDDIVSLYLQEELTDEEVMRLLMEEGEEISFEGCVLPADESNDGEEHEIHSFEEFYQWKR